MELVSLLLVPFKARTATLFPTRRHTNPQSTTQRLGHILPSQLKLFISTIFTTPLSRTMLHTEMNIQPPSSQPSTALGLTFHPMSKTRSWRMTLEGCIRRMLFHLISLSCQLLDIILTLMFSSLNRPSLMSTAIALVTEEVH
jgi:hypothetical protein